MFKQDNTVNCQCTELMYSSQSNPSLNSLFSPGLFRPQTCICNYCCLPDLQWIPSNLGRAGQLKEQERQREINRPREKKGTQQKRKIWRWIKRKKAKEWIKWKRETAEWLLSAGAHHSETLTVATGWWVSVCLNGSLSGLQLWGGLPTCQGPRHINQLTLSSLTLLRHWAACH